MLVCREGCRTIGSHSYGTPQSLLYPSFSLAQVSPLRDTARMTALLSKLKCLHAPSPTNADLPLSRRRTPSFRPEQDITTQLNFSLSEIFLSLDHTRLWSILCIRPNNSSSHNSLDKRRVKPQIRSLLLPDVIAKRSIEYVVGFELGSFCDRYLPTMPGSEQEHIVQCARANGWKEGGL
jgi:chitin synthase